MAMYGNQLLMVISGRTSPTVIGTIQMMDGCGCPIIAGDGAPFITEDRFKMMCMDGYGFPVMNGHPPGLPGEWQITIMHGRL